MKGDRVEVVIDSGEGTQTYEVTATRAGRRVEITNRRGDRRGQRGDPDRHPGPDRPVHGQPRCGPGRVPG